MFLVKGVAMKKLIIVYSGKAKDFNFKNFIVRGEKNEKKWNENEKKYHNNGIW